MKGSDNKEKQRYPIITLLRNDELTKGQKAGVYIGLILTLCAIGVFIWIIVSASKSHSPRGIVMASSFILFAVGFLYFFLARINNPKRAWIFLYLTIPLAVGAFIISLYLDSGTNARCQNEKNAILIENTCHASNESVVGNTGILD